MNRTEYPEVQHGRRLHDQHGVVGRAMVVWLLIAIVFGVAALDVVAIARDTFRLSEVAIEAASAGVTVFRNEGRSVTKACEAVASSVETQAPALNLGRNGCRVDIETGRVTVTLRMTADTTVAGRLGPLQEYTHIVVVESNGPSNV